MIMTTSYHPLSFLFHSSLSLLPLLFSILLSLYYFKQAVTAIACPWMSWPCQIQKIAFHSTSPHAVALTVFVTPWCGLVVPGLVEGIIVILVRTDDPKVSYYQNFDQLWVILTITWYNERLLSSRLKAAWIYGITCRCLECSLTPWQ